MWPQYVWVKEIMWERGKENKVYLWVRCIHICSVPNTCGAHLWPIVGREDKLYLALQTGRELSAVSSRFLFRLFWVILWVSLSFTDSSRLLSTCFSHLLSRLYFSVFCLFPVLFNSLIFPLFFSLLIFSLIISSTWVRDTVKIWLVSLLFAHNVILY